MHWFNSYLQPGAENVIFLEILDFHVNIRQNRGKVPEMRKSCQNENAQNLARQTGSEKAWFRSKSAISAQNHQKARKY